jgi:hypothetical protein
MVAILEMLDRVTRHNFWRRSSKELKKYTDGGIWKALQWLTQWKGRVGDWKMWKDENLIPAKQTWLVYCGQKLGLISFKWFALWEQKPEELGHLVIQGAQLKNGNIVI